MRDKLLWLAVAVLAAMLVTSRAQSPTPQASSNYPRFQLFVAEREIDSPRDKGPLVYRIDTQTGEVATYREGVVQNVGSDKKPYPYRYWEKVDEKFVLHDGFAEVGRALSEVGMHNRPPTLK
jgi:hypothetical protein